MEIAQQWKNWHSIANRHSMTRSQIALAIVFIVNIQYLDTMNQIVIGLLPV